LEAGTPASWTSMRSLLPPAGCTTGSFTPSALMRFSITAIVFCWTSARV
jgi:hypothetical protein